VHRKPGSKSVAQLPEQNRARTISSHCYQVYYNGPACAPRVRVWGNTLIGQAIDADTTWGGLDSRSPPARVVWGDLQSLSIAPTSMLWGNLERATWTSRNRSRIPSHHWRCEWH